MSGGNTTWITNTLAELSLRKQAVTTATQQGTAAPVTLPPGSRTTQLPAPPSGSGPAHNKLSKFLANSTFGDPDDRKGISAEKQAVQAEVMAAITQQHQLGTAAPVSIPIKGNRQLSGNFFSAEGHNLRTAQNNAPDTTRPVVLFLSGSGGTAEEYGTDVAEFYQESGASVLAANFRGYGNSSDCQPSEKSLMEDGQAMLQYLLDLGYTEDQIIIHGFSMGGAVAGKLQAHNEKKGHQFRGLVMDRPMVSVTAGVDAHAPEKIKEALGDDYDETTKTNKALTKITSWATRRSVGSMSARKALRKSDSDTPVVVTGDEGRFATDGADLRTALRTKDPNRSVQGVQSNKDHLDTKAMLAGNDTFLKELIDKKRDGTPDPFQASGLSADQKKGALGMRRAILARIEEIETAKVNVINDVTSANANVQAFIGNANYLNHFATNRGPGIMATLKQLLADSNELARLAETAIDQAAALRVATLQTDLRGAMETLNETFELAGAAQAPQAELVEATLVQAGKDLARYTGFPNPSVFTGQTRLEQLVLADDAKLRKMATAGFVFAGADATLVRDVATAAAAINQRLNPPPTPTVAKPPKDAWKRNSTGAIPSRGQAKVQLRKSFG